MSEYQTGEQYMCSPITGQWFRVTRWKDLGGGKARALEKEEVKASEVPAELRDDNGGTD